MTKMHVPFNLLLAVMGQRSKKNRTYFDPNTVLEAAKNQVYSHRLIILMHGMVILVIVIGYILR